MPALTGETPEEQSERLKQESEATFEDFRNAANYGQTTLAIAYLVPLLEGMLNQLETLGEAKEEVKKPATRKKKVEAPVEG